MDIEKKIQILRACSSKKGNRCSSCPAFGQGNRNCMRNAMKDAATALSTLQAENKRLKNKLSELAHLPFNGPGIGERTRLMAENEKLRAELERAKRERDAAVKDLNEFLSMDELCPIQCEWCKWNGTYCDGKTPEWHGVQNE